MRGSILRPSNFGHLPKTEINYGILPKILTAADYQNALYRKYVENKPRPEYDRRRRRVIPNVAESDASQNFNSAEPYAEVPEAIPKGASRPSSISKVGNRHLPLSGSKTSGYSPFTYRKKGPEAETSTNDTMFTTKTTGTGTIDSAEAYNTAPSKL